MHKTLDSGALKKDPLKAYSVVPVDFPHNSSTAAITGTQTKFSARLIDGKYVVGLKPRERYERCLNCIDILEQLVTYVRRKLHEHPAKTLSDVLDNVVSRIPRQDWDLVNSEIE